MKYIGIDPGTNTGIAVWDTEKQCFESIETKTLHRALWLVYDYYFMGPIKLFIEDPNTWRPFKGNKSSNAKIQGAGSVKRDFAIWKEFCDDYSIPFVRTKIQGTMKKIRPDVFLQLTGWSKLTSEHGRDAAMLVFGMTNKEINLPEPVSI